MDYQTEANGQSYDSVDNYAAADAYRSSDHDPIVIGVNLPEDNSSPGHGDDDHHGPGHGDHHGEDHNPLKRFLVGLIRWIFSWF